MFLFTDTLFGTVSEGFINRSVGVGLGYGLFIGGQYQFTPGYGPLWQWKK